MSNPTYNFFDIQQEIKEFWIKNNTYKTEKLNKEKYYTIDTPPPTVSGSLHIGHISSYTQTDLIARYKRITGHTVFYPFGSDDNGLPTERYVEKELNITSSNMSRSDFISTCLNQVTTGQKSFIHLWQTIGLSIDFAKYYSTISKDVQKISQKSFIDLYKKGYIYSKNEPALYCTAYRTSVSQAELEDIEKETFFTTLKFKLKNLNENILIATTRPEMLSGCVAIFYNPDDIRYNKFNGQYAITPIYNKEVPILPDDKVIIDKGTGLVMCCTFGDSLDVYWFKKYNLPYLKVIELNGKMSSITEILEGKSVSDARTEILKLLEEQSYISSKIKIKHNVAIYERSKREIEYVMLRQWFVKILENKEKFLELANKINWYPENMKYRYINWVENLQWDWCISRQRFFGIPFPVWYDKNDNIIFPNEKDLPIDPLKDKPKNIDEYTPDTDVMDTWNTSSLSPFICEDLYKQLTNDNTFKFFPMSMRPQAHDIIRTWAFDTIVKAWMHYDNIPWKDIVISGHILSSDSQKISKSKDNSPMNPLNLIKLYPADAIRYWTANAKLGIDIAFSENELKKGNKLLVKLWNASIFIEEHADFKNYKNFNFNAINLYCNIWIMHELKKCLNLYEKYFEKNEFSLALESVESFFWKCLCDNYLEIIKAHLFNNNNNNEVNEVKNTLAYVFEKLLQMLSPYLIFTTEKIYQNLYRKNYSEILSIHKINIKETQKEFLLQYNNEFDIILNFINIIRKIKSDLKVSLKYKIDNLMYNSELKNIEFIKNHELILKLLFHIENIQYNDSIKETKYNKNKESLNMKIFFN